MPWPLIVYIIGVVVTFIVSTIVVKAAGAKISGLRVLLCGVLWPFFWLWILLNWRD